VTVARGAGVVEPVDRPSLPSTVVPLPDRPRTTSLSGRPATISTAVTTTSTPTKTPAHAAANAGQPRRGAGGGTATAGGRGARRATVPTRRREWLYTALPTTVSTLAIAAPITVPATPRNDAPTVAVIAANALATTCTTDSWIRGRSVGAGPLLISWTDCPWPQRVFSTTADGVLRSPSPRLRK